MSIDEEINRQEKRFYKELHYQTLHCPMYFAGYCYKKHTEPVRCFNEKNWFWYLLGDKNKR